MIFRTQGVAHPAIEEIDDEGALHSDIEHTKELDLGQITPAKLKGLNVNKL